MKYDDVKYEVVDSGGAPIRPGDRLYVDEGDGIGLYDYVGVVVRVGGSLGSSCVLLSVGGGERIVDVSRVVDTEVLE